ncbi:MAG: glycosyltransferase family 9 protein [Chloroflexi bacterium]|nr:glycosyltransferase family 9 protein [Chloroflexota bacterium]
MSWRKLRIQQFLKQLSDLNRIKVSAPEFIFFLVVIAACLFAVYFPLIIERRLYPDWLESLAQNLSEHHFWLVVSCFVPSLLFTIIIFWIPLIRKLKKAGIKMPLGKSFLLTLRLVFFDANCKFQMIFAVFIVVELMYLINENFGLAVMLLIMYAGYNQISKFMYMMKPPSPPDFSPVDIPLESRDRWNCLPEIEKIIEDKACGNLNPKGSLLIIRGGELGDVIMTTPVIRALHEKYPKMKINYITRIRRALWHNPFVSKILPWEAPYDCYTDILKADKILDFRGLIEMERGIPAIPCLAGLAGVDLVKSTPDFYISGEDEKWVEKFFRSNNLNFEKVISLQAGANSPARLWPWDNIKKLARLLADDGWMVLLLDDRGREFETPGLYNLTAKTTLGRAAALIKSSSMLVGPDSSFLHIAAAFDVPCIGIFSVIPPGLRISTYPRARGIMAKTECSPCYDQFNRCDHEPKFCCIRSITAEDVLEEVRKLALEMKL